MTYIYNLIKTTNLAEKQIEDIQENDYSTTLRHKFDNILDSNKSYEILYKDLKNIINNKNNIYVNFSSSFSGNI